MACTNEDCINPECQCDPCECTDENQCMCCYDNSELVSVDLV